MKQFRWEGMESAAGAAKPMHDIMRDALRSTLFTAPKS